MPDTKNRGGRPRIDAVPITVRLPPDLLAVVDRYIAGRGKPLSRPEAIREILKSIYNGDEPCLATSRRGEP